MNYRVISVNRETKVENVEAYFKTKFMAELFIERCGFWNYILDYKVEELKYEN